MNPIEEFKLLMQIRKFLNEEKENYKMNSTVKPGWKTTYFWLTLLSNVVPIVGSLKGVIPPDKAAMIIGIINGVYGIIRSFSTANAPVITPVVTVAAPVAPTPTPTVIVAN